MARDLFSLKPEPVEVEHDLIETLRPKIIQTINEIQNILFLGRKNPHIEITGSLMNSRILVEKDYILEGLPKSEYQKAIKLLLECGISLTKTGKFDFTDYYLLTRGW